MEKSKERFFVTKPYLPKYDRFMHYANSIWEQRWLTNAGPLVGKLQDELSKKLDINHIVVFSNGHMALDCALKALGLHSGEAITTPFTYISTANAIAMNGLRPVFCDIKENDCTIDEDKIEALITDKTKVIVPVHVYGFPCNHERIQAIADKHNLKVVYDAAHAFGVKVDGKGISRLGDASMLSFHATKVFHTVEGGGVAFQDDSLLAPLVSAKNFGLVNKENATTISFNAKMTEIHAAMGLANLEIIDWEIAQRKIVVKQYLKKLSGLQGINLFSWDSDNIEYNYAYFPICVDEAVAGIGRDELQERLDLDYNIQTRKYFYPLLSNMDCYKDISDSSKTPIAKKIAEHILCLPLYVDLTPEQVNYICDAIKEILM